MDSTYDPSGRLINQSHPYSGMGDSNRVSETFAYDALDRQLSNTHPDNETQQVFYGPSITSSLGLASQQGSTVTYGWGYPQVSEDGGLDQISAPIDGWKKLFRDTRDGRHWELPYRQSEMHGGGAPPLKVVSEPSSWQ